ncbi:hypothetical protein VTL71DRAFT_8177 [Oculimacula yallundae]|uniref:BTB domain-containing protein n=1 Tax=Oculimacula yallundae TaxID=86028 RepID=A0ABR4CWV9_9HELO
MSENPCLCSFCWYMEAGPPIRAQRAGRCQRSERLAAHKTAVSELTAIHSEKVKLLVGTDEHEFSCHKALLAYFSPFFKRAFYGSMKESNTGVMKLPEEKAELIETLVSWVNSGLVESENSPEHLWAMGDRLTIPLFSNEVMHIMFRMYDTCWGMSGFHCLRAEAAQIACKDTPTNSKLSTFVRDYVFAHGPLNRSWCDDARRGPNYILDWHNFIHGGGDLVLEICIQAGFNKPLDDINITPCKPDNQHKYLIPV